MAKHFKRYEMACPCGCGFDAMDEELMDVLDDIRDHFGQPVHVTSGCRCWRHNASINGAPGSQHVFGKAADVVVEGTQPWDVQRYVRVKYHDKYGIGLAKDFTHIDVRGNKARWRY